MGPNTAAAPLNPDLLALLAGCRAAPADDTPRPPPARTGSLLLLVADGAAAPSVAWPPADNANAAGLPAATQYVSAAGQAIDQKVTWGPGTYHFQCDVHAAMGMKGTLTVQ